MYIYIYILLYVHIYIYICIIYMYIYYMFYFGGVHYWVLCCRLAVAPQGQEALSKGKGAREMQCGPAGEVN